MFGLTQDKRKNISLLQQHTLNQYLQSHTSCCTSSSSPPGVRCENLNVVLLGWFCSLHEQTTTAEMSQVLGGDFCKQILSNVTRCFSAVGAGKHLTQRRRCLWELNPRLLQLQSFYWPSSQKKKKLHTIGATMAAGLLRSSKKVVVKTSITSLSRRGILYIYACVSVCGWRRDVPRPLSRRCVSAACRQRVLRWVTGSALLTGMSAEFQK